MMTAYLAAWFGGYLAAGAVMWGSLAVEAIRRRWSR